MRNASIALLALTLTMVVACSKGSGSGADLRATRPALPSAWLNGSDADASFATPSQEATESVRASFSAHTFALEQISSRGFASEAIDADGQHPVDWVPWHLDGLIAGFGVDFGGVFGSLMADGSPSIKVTWQKQSAPKAAAKSPRSTAVRLHPGMSAADVSLLIEPAIRAAIVTGSVRNETALRRSLNDEGLKFLSFIRALSTVAPGQRWHVDGYQLSLAVSASGNVTPLINVGGTFTVILDWQVTPGAPAVVAAPVSEREWALQEQASGLLGTLMALLPDARAETAELRKAGFDFQVFQVGLGITAGGNIGVATASASAGGRIIFKKGGSSALMTALELPSGMETVPLILAGTSTEDAVVAAANSVASPATNPTAALVQVPSNRLRNGLKRAIRMGTFFAKQSVASESANWKTTEIEIGLDASVGGQINLITVAGSGLIRIGLERVE